MKNRFGEMPLNNSTYGNTNRQPRNKPADPIYNLDDPSFCQTLDFRPHSLGPGFEEECQKIQRFRGFKRLNEAYMKEKKRSLVQESGFQGGKKSFGNMNPAPAVPVYEVSILERRQQSLTGKESFNVYEVYTLWGEESKAGDTRLKEVCIRWDKFNGRVQLFALVSMVHPNKKAESGKFLEANGLVGLSMVPHKDNPNKVATGGNWAGQGYWVPYVVALYYARHWSFEYRYLFALIWGPEFPETCKRPGDPGYRNNLLERRVIEAAKIESDYFLKKAKELVTEHINPSKKKCGRGSAPATNTQRCITVSTASNECSQNITNSPRTFAISSPPKPSPHIEHFQPFTSSTNTIHHTNQVRISAPPMAPASYDPMCGSRNQRYTNSWVQPYSTGYSVTDQKQLHMDSSVNRRQQSNGARIGLNHTDPSRGEMGPHPSEWGKRKRGPEENSPHSPGNANEEQQRSESIHPAQQVEQRDSHDSHRCLKLSGSKAYKQWVLEDTYVRRHKAGEDCQMQEQEAAAALMLLSGNDAPLIGRAAITA